MELWMIQCMRKLALWHTKTFKPIMTHEELDPIMSTLGFLAQPESLASNGVVWKEYLYTARSCRRSLLLTALPKPRLPSHRINGGLRIDGLHLNTYLAFIDAVNFYLQMDFVSDLFHIRGIPLELITDRNKKFRKMDDNASIYVYKEGTLDYSSHNLHYLDENNNVTSTNGDLSATNIRSNGNNNVSIGFVVPLKDIIKL